MSKTAPQNADSTVDAEAVRAFLRENPDFIREDAELFALLARADRGAGIVDLGEKAREKLAAELRQTKALNEGLVETARANLAVQSQVHMALLASLECDNLSALDKKLAGRAAYALGVDVIRVYVENHAPLRGAETIFGAADGLVESVLGEKMELLGPVQSRFADALYGPQAARVKSEAIVRLDMSGRSGLIAFAAADPRLFVDGQGTELLSFFARALERLMTRWISQR